MIERQCVDHMKKGRCKKAQKVMTPAEICQELESSPDPLCKLLRLLFKLKAALN